MRASLAVLVPQLCDAGVELAELRGEDDVMSMGQTVQEAGAVLAGALDLRTDVVDCFHTCDNETARSRIPASRPLPVSELANPVLVEPEEMADLVEHRDPDLAAQLHGIGKCALERPLVDHDRVRERAGVILAEADAEIHAEQPGLVGVLLLDDDGDVVEHPGELVGQLVERRLDLILELHQYAGRRGRRFRKTQTASSPKRNPPMWAKNATPPPC